MFHRQFLRHWTNVIELASGFAGGGDFTNELRIQKSICEISTYTFGRFAAVVANETSRVSYLGCMHGG